MLIAVSKSGVMKAWPKGSKIAYCEDTDVWYGLMGTVGALVLSSVEIKQVTLDADVVRLER